MSNGILDPKMLFRTCRIGLKSILVILVGHLWEFLTTKKHPHVRCVHILSEGVEGKGALGRMAGEEIQSGGYTLSLTAGGGVKNR